MPRILTEVLADEKKHRIKGGIYNKLQVDFAYNSNHIEGSRLSREQTRYIFETKTVGIEPARVDDIIETVNHFRAFDLIIDTFACEISGDYIKNIHKTLKTGTLSADSEEAVVGDYKKYPNYVGDMQTAKPADVPDEMHRLITAYSGKNPDFDDILAFHAQFEKIHPFYDGNGRTGRLLMFKECLKNGMTPFIIADEYKAYYYNGLNKWQMGGDKAYLRDTCLLMQDNMKAVLDYFGIAHQ